MRRCVVADNWNDIDDESHVQGLYYAGNRDAQLVIQECIFMHNGDPAVTGWPPVGTQKFDIFSRNFYLSGNTIYPSRTAAAAGQGWTDPDRTLKSYLIARGHTVTTDDGYMEYFNAAMDQRKGQWDPDLTARAINNYFREGFNMTALP